MSFCFPFQIFILLQFTCNCCLKSYEQYICSIFFCYWYALWITFHFNVYIKDKCYFWFFFVYNMFITNCTSIYFFVRLTMLKLWIISYWNNAFTVQFVNFSNGSDVHDTHVFESVQTTPVFEFLKFFFIFLLVRRQILTVLIIKMSFLKLMPRSYF